MIDTYTCVLSLKPASWIQTVGNGDSSLTSIGQSLLMISEPVEDSNLVLSDGTRVQGLEVTLSISNTSKPIRGDGTPLEHGIGLLSHHSTQNTIGGWFCLRPSDFAEAWEQIRNGGYSECDIEMEIGPVVGKGPDWLWQTSNNRALFIEAARIDFTKQASRGSVRRTKTIQMVRIKIGSGLPSERIEKSPPSESPHDQLVGMDEPHRRRPTS
jgi:hypothetical protein